MDTEAPSPLIEASPIHAWQGVLGANGLTYTWGRNEHWQLGYEVVGLLNSGMHHPN